MKAACCMALLIALAASMPAGARTVRSAHFVITHANRDDIAGLAEALEGGYRTVREFGLRLPSSIDVRVHATTQEFAVRSGAGRFHLAGVRGSTLHLQPVGVLRRQPGLGRALTHEIVHVALAEAASRMPRWLSEGVAMMIAGELQVAGGDYATPAELDGALVTARSHEEARRAYGAAASLVRALRTKVGSARMLSAMRAIASGGEANAAFRSVAGLDLGKWASGELEAAKTARMRAPR
jgi:hypothetical protein